jgi:DNA-binding NtrC family response regulator
VLQEKEFRPVGSLQRIRADVRIVAATHRNLEREVAAGRFREDLFHRLNVIRITLPPLRERKEDIPLLIERFLAESETRYILTNEALEAMLAYDWPGNIRELKNCLDRMMVLNSGPLLHFVDLPTSVVFHNRSAKLVEAAAIAGGGQRNGPTAPTGGVLPLQELERIAIAQALRHTKGDRTVAAQLLGIGRTTLYRKLKEYRITDQDCA